MALHPFFWSLTSPLQELQDNRIFSTWGCQPHAQPLTYRTSVTYRVIQEESAIIWEMIVCVILSKKVRMNIGPILNGYRDMHLCIEVGGGIFEHLLCIEVGGGIFEHLLWDVPDVDEPGFCPLKIISNTMVSTCMHVMLVVMLFIT